MSVSLFSYVFFLKPSVVLFVLKKYIVLSALPKVKHLPGRAVKSMNFSFVLQGVLGSTVLALVDVLGVFTSEIGFSTPKIRRSDVL